VPRSGVNGSSKPKGWAWGDASVVLALVALAAIAYGASLRHDFVFDDTDSIRDNLLIRDLANYWPFASGYWQHPTRYVGYLTFALNYAAGGVDVVGFRAVNVVVHLANALLVYVLVLTLFKTPVGERSSVAASARAAGFLAAALFVAHPLQTSAVTYIVQRLTSLATFFYLATVVQYARWRIRRDSLSRAASGARYAGILLTSALAMKTKEIAVTVPVTLFILEWLFFGRPRRSAILALLPILGTAILVPASVVQWHGDAGQVLSDVSQVTHVQTQLSRLDYLRTQCAVLLTYLRLLLLPVDQNVDYDYPVYSSFADAPVVLGCVVLAGLAGTAAYLAWRSRPSPGVGGHPLDPAARVVAFGIAWFFVTIAVESSVIPIVDVIFEHRVYLPSVGMFVAVAAAAMWIVARAPGRRRIKAVIAGGAILALVLAGATALRNRVWSSPITLWSDTLSKSPAKVRPYVNLGAALVDSGDIGRAIPLLQRAIQLDPDDPQANHALGRALLVGRGDLELATRLIERALTVRPNYPEALANLGAVLNRQRRYDETIARLESARSIIDRNVEAHFNLGVAYAMKRDTLQAEAEARTLDGLSPPLANQLRGLIARNGS
jgi:protein O-mannosyl-transferase